MSPIGSTATRLLSGQSFDTDDLLEVLRQEEQRRQQQGSKRDKLVHDAADFETDRWAEDLDADFGLLSEVLDRVKDIRPEDDDKLRALRRFLDRSKVRAGKVLIFSEAETTVEYLYRELNPDAHDPEIARLTGSTSHDRGTDRQAVLSDVGIWDSASPGLVLRLGSCWRRT